MFDPVMLNRGNHRIVWTTENPDEVVKLPRYNKRFTHRSGLIRNLEEWMVYHNLADEELRRWLCRPIRIDYAGLALIMERGEPIQKHEIPKDVPEIIRKQDNTYPNWVKVNGIYKRCDYHPLYKPLIKRQENNH